MTIVIDASAFHEMAERFGASDEQISAAFIRAGNKVGQEGVKIARQILASNGSVVTRGLYDSIESRGTTRQGDAYTIQYGPSEKYPGEWVEKGRPPVSARQGGMLKFQIKGRGPYLYRKRVNAARARPFMRPSVQRLRPIATDMFGQEVMKAIQGVL